MTINVQILYQMVGDLFDEIDNLDPKSYDFINQAAEYEEDGRMFTEPQAKWIEDLHRRFCG